jgi:NTP pyrophosphatase (non-canonical NTP hydrolase)
MEFKKIKQGVVNTALNYGEKYKIKIDQDFALLKLQEEMGEFMQAVLVYKKKSRPEKYTSEEEVKRELSHELADLLGMVLVNAYLLDIDLEKAIKEKWLSRNK